MTRGRYWATGALSLAVLVAGNWWLNRAYQAERAPETLPDRRVDYALTDFDAAFFDERGRESLRVAGPRLTHDALTREARIEAPRFELEPARQGWSGRAETGTVARDADTLVLTGDVRLSRPHERGPVIVTSERLDYDRAAATVVSPGPVRVEQAGNELTGGTLVVWIDDERMELDQHVHAIYRGAGAAAGR